MTLAFKLTHDEPKLVYLALVYHLGRPGSELDPETMQPKVHGLREVKVALGNDLTADAAIVELNDWQLQRLFSAIQGCVTELRGYHMRDGAPSGIDRWTETAETLFPAIREHPDAALALAESMMMLRRRMDRAISGAPRAEASGPAEARRRWPFSKA